MKRSLIVPLLLTLALCACATHPPPTRRVDMANACAADITGLPTIPLRPNEPLAQGKKAKPVPVLEFADVGHCVVVPSGRIPAALFKFEGVRPPAQISLQISALQTATLATAVTLLDSRHQPLRRYGFDSFSRRGTSFTLDLFINPNDVDATYLLLSPDAAWVGKEDTGVRAGTNTYSSAGPVYFAYNVGYEEKISRQLTDAGSLQIEIRSLPASP